MSLSTPCAILPNFGTRATQRTLRADATGVGVRRSLAARSSVLIPKHAEQGGPAAQPGKAHRSRALAATLARAATPLESLA